MLLEVNERWMSDCTRALDHIQLAIREFRQILDATADPRIVDRERILAQMHPALFSFVKHYDLFAVASRSCRDSLQRFGEDRDLDEVEVALQLDEQALHHRRLVENLLILIALEPNHDSADHYQHLTSQTELSHWNRQQNDLQAFFGRTSQVIATRIATLNGRITGLEAGNPPRVDPAACPYLQAGRRGRWERCSEQQLFLNVIANATNLEAFALGLSYQSIFGKASQHIHFALNVEHQRIVNRSAFAEALEHTILLICVSLIRLAPRLFNSQLPEGHGGIRDRFSNELPEPLITSLLGPAQAGDFVLWRAGTFWIPSEVIGVHNRTIGAQKYFSYELDALDGRRTSWAPSVDLLLMVPTARIVEFINSAVDGEIIERTDASTNRAGILAILRSPRSNELLMRFLNDSNLRRNIFGEVA